jgi:hypothetical protein
MSMMASMQARGILTDVRSEPPASAASPPAQRPVRARWRDPRLVVGVLLVAGCALLGARFVGGADDTVAVWATARSLQPGQPLSTDDLRRQQVRFEDQADADRYVSADDPLPAGAPLARAVGAGELLPRSALGEPRSVSLTEVPLSVPTDAVPGTVRTGSVVDVWVTPEAGGAGTSGAGSGGSGGSDGGPAARSVLVLDDVPVLGAPRSGTTLGPSATRQVVVGVAAAQADELPVALTALAGGTALLTVQR